MGVVQANNDGGGQGGLVNREISTWDEGKEVRNGMVGEGQGLGSSEEDEPGSNEIIEDANKGSEEAIQVHDGLQQSQGSTIHWDRFLPIRSLKVLLVENDDSTRHVVTALLRNCSYEVTAVANSLQAWKILEDLTNHIDLILTEVVMPFISGIGLLCKIMSHKTFKNIPVIMMSSHDSMGIVFKCLSKGAVDFLVKPIRKNELKNLWQHVWRRCHSSSGSGSESGTQTKKSVKSKSNDESENNTGSSDEHDNGSTGTSIRDGSDNGSGTQNSWTRRAAEVDSPQPLSPMDQLADAPDSTCAQVIHTKPETLSNQWVHVIETKECQGTEEQPDNVAMGRDLELGVARNPDVQLEYQHEKCSTYPTCKRQNKLPESDSNPFDKGHLENNGASANNTDPLVESRDFENPIGLSDVSQIKDKGSCETREQPNLDLSLKRLRGAGDVGACVHDDRSSLRHSDLSAFSKYNTASSANQAPTGNVGSCSPLDNSSVAMKTETINNFTSHVDGNLPNQQSNGSSNNIDMASTTNYAVPKPEAYNEKSESTSAFKCFHTSAFQPVTSGRMFPPQKISSGKEDDIVVDAVEAQAIGSHQPVQVQHHHHHYHHYHHHVHSMQPQSQPQLQPQTQQQSDNDDRFLNNMAAAAPQCGSSNAFGGPAEGNAANYSINGSASGSNHGSNGQNGSSNALNVGATNMEGDNGAAGNSGAGAISGKGSGNRVEEERFAQREAALTKFRQKRKERCFEKKVRYQSRKKLAEQRPRIRGQFVRQNVSDSKAGKDEPSDDTMSANNSCDGGLR